MSVLGEFVKACYHKCIITGADKIKFETKKRKYKYEIFAVMSVNANEFQYWGFTMARDEADFDAYTQKVVESSTVVAGRMPKYGEQLLALSTCDNGKGKDWRFVVLGRKV